MGDEDLVVAVRLCDTIEADQPDPLCLRHKDLETWRHFESLLRGMYKNAPDAISVTYLDDENDWVQVGSDAELAEAVRIAKEAGDILQLQVKRLDAEQLITFENTVNEEPGQFVLYIPTADQGGNGGLPPLVYPHHTIDHSSEVDGPKLTPAVSQNEPVWLVYPHHTEKIDFPVSLESEAQNPWEKFESFQSSNEPLAPKDLNTLCVDKDKPLDKNSTPLWEEAACLPAEEKLKFMKNLMDINAHKTVGQHELKKEEKEKNDKENILLTGIASEKSEVTIGPLCSEQGSLGKSFIPNQDPFEVDAIVSTPYFEHVMINLEKDKSPTLTPKRANANKNEPIAKYFRMSSVETDGAASVSNVDICRNKPFQDLIVPAHSGQSATLARLAYTSALPKSKVLKRVPVPMPRNLLMMEGAQSGANAVAIEIPSESSDFFQGAAINKEEEIAASGGAASTSASEETGEVLTRGDSVAAAVSREVKVSSPLVEVYAISGEGDRHKSEKKVKRNSSKPKHSSKKEKCSEKKQEAGIDGAKPKSSEKSERKSSEHRKKEDSNSKEVKKDEKKVKITEDVESGEKLNTKRDATALSRCDFAKYMKKTKKDLHLAIVKDVARLTETYFSKVVERTSMESLINDIFGIREPICHKGVYCDECNREIYGIRYKCGNCLDFDLCSICENKPNLHDRTHVFLKLRSPARRAGVGDGQKYCLLVENIYVAESQKSLQLDHLEGVCEDKSENSHHSYADNEQTEYSAPPVMPTTTTTDLEKEQMVPSDISQISISPLNTEKASSSSHEELDHVSVSDKQVENSFDLMCNTAAMGCTKETVESKESLDTVPLTKLQASTPRIVESIPLTKLQPSTPLASNDLTEVAECGEQSPTLSDSSSSVVPVTPSMMNSPSELAPLAEEAKKCLCWDCHNTIDFQAAIYSMGAADEEEIDDLPELISEETLKYLNPEKYADDDDDEGNSSSFEEMASDTSDDFCVIEPPESHLDLNEYEPLPDDVEEEEDVHVEKEVENHVCVKEEEEVEQSKIVHATIERETSAQPTDNVDDTVCNSSSSDLKDETSAVVINKSVEVTEEKNTADEVDNEVKDGVKQDNEEKEVEQETEEQQYEVSVNGLVHTMNDEEKTRFAQLLRAEMDKEYEWELKVRAFELEKKLVLQKEKEFQLILEAKERAAAFENERLEWVAQKRQEEDRLSNISRQTSVASVSSLSGSVSDDDASRSRKDADCQTIPEPSSPATHIIQNVASGVSRAATTAFYTAKDVFYSLQARQNEWKNAVPSYSCKPSQSDLRFVKNPAQQIAEHTDGFEPTNNQVLPTAPVEVNTFPDTTHLNDVVDNVKSPSLSEGHESSDSVKPARDPLQSPESEGNVKVPHPRPVSCWVPPKNTFKPPVSTWTPPRDDYIPPTSTWVPKKQEFIPPNIQWITTAQAQKTQGTLGETERSKEGRGTESEATAITSKPQEHSRRPSLTSSSQKAPPFAALEIADTALRRELQGMHRLIEMGFANREKNRQLLNKFDNDLEKVVQCLLQEEGEAEDSHWALHRH